MKRNYILGSLWIVIALLLTFLLISGFEGSNKTKRGLHNFSKWLEKNIDDSDWDDDWDDEAGEEDYMKSEINTQQTNEYEAVGIRNIETNLRSIAVEVSESTDSKIHIDFEDGAEKRVLITNSGSRILVKEMKKKGHLFMSGKVLISLPGDYSESIDIESVSGSVKIRDISLREAEIQAVSGSVNISNCDIERLEIEAVSGSIKMEGNYKSVSAQSVSGSIRLESSSELSGRCSFESVSGSVSLAIPASCGYEMEYESMSGSFKDEITGLNGSKSGSSRNGNGDAKITVNTVSGSIKIEKR